VELAREGRLTGAYKIGGSWIIRKESPYPADARIKTGDYKDWRNSPKSRYKPQKTITTGDKIRSVRVLADITQEQLAERTGISISAIKAYENNSFNVSLNNLLKIAEVLGIKVEMLEGEKLDTKPRGRKPKDKIEG
jgi:DNA-binding XRE family transcriptional regulator